MAAEGLMFPHNFFIPLLGVICLVLNCLNLAACFGGQHKLNAVETLQIIKTSFVLVALVALVTCIPLSANLDGGDDYKFAIFTGVKDIMDILLIHSKPMAFAVIAIVRFRITTCLGNPRILVPLRWSLVAMALSMVPVIAMVLCRIYITVHAANHVQKNEIPEKMEGWGTEKIFHVVIMCILNVLPLIVGTGFYVKIQSYLCQAQFARNNHVKSVGSVCSGNILSSQLSPRSNQDNLSFNPSITHGQNHSRTNTSLRCVVNSSGNRPSTKSKQNSPINASIGLQLISCLVSWMFYIIVELLYLVDTIALHDIFLLYAKLIILTVNPVGDGLFLQQKRERLTTHFKKLCHGNRVYHIDEAQMNTISTRCVNKLATLPEEEELRPEDLPVEICLQVLPTSLPTAGDERNPVIIPVGQASGSNISLASLSSLRDDLLFADEFHDGEITKIQTTINNFEAEGRETKGISSTEPVSFGLRSDCHGRCSEFSYRSGAACPTPSRTSRVNSEASSYSQTSDTKSLFGQSRRSYKNGSGSTASYLSSRSVDSNRLSIASRCSRASSNMSKMSSPSSVFSISYPQPEDSMPTNPSSLKSQSCQDMLTDTSLPDIDDGPSDITEYF